MTFLKVLLVILAVLWLISLIRVGGRVAYGQAGLSAAALAGPFRIQLIPAKRRKEKPKKERKPKKEKPPREKKPRPEGQPGTLSRLMKLLPVVGQACGALKRKIRIDELELELIWGGGDAAAIALGYGQANAALGMLWPILDHNFKVKRHSFQISMDYNAAQPLVELRAAVTLTIGQIVALGVRYGVKALVTWIRSGRPAGKRAAAAKAEKSKKPKKQEAMNHE